MYDILTLNKIAKVGLDTLDSDLFSVSGDSPDPDGVLVRSASLHEFPLDGKLKAIARAGAGVNNIPVDRCSDAGVVVFNTPGVNAGGVKELAICALFLTSRDIAGGIAWAKSLAGRGDEVPRLVEKGKSKFAGCEIAGKTLGVVGLGAIGVMVANAARDLGMKVLGFDPYLSVDSAWGLSRDIHRARDLAHLYAESDYITLHLPLNDDTRRMMNANTLSQCKPGVRIVNLARGDLVCSDGLLAALDSGQVAAYATDFPNDALLTHPKVVPIPHLGASTAESEDNCAIMAASQMSDYLLYGNIRNSVNFPDIALAFGVGGVRMCVAHKNIPNMVSLVTTSLAEEGINIDNMVNKSKKEYAFMLLDINASPSAQKLAALKRQDGILHVRIIDTKK